MGAFGRIFKRNIALLLSAQMISTMGSIMQTTALSLFVLSKTGSALTFASVLVVAIVPRLFGPFTGVVTDRMNRKRMLVVLDIIAGFMTLCFALWHYFFGLQITCVYLIVLILSAIQTFYDPTVSAIIPELVDRDALEETNSASSLVSNLAYIAAAALAGIIYMNYGLFAVMVVNAASFFIAAAFETIIRYKVAPEVHMAAKAPVFKAMKEGLSTVFHNRELTLIILISIAANLALNPIFSVGMPYIMKKVLNVSDSMYGISQAMLFIGPVIGSVLAGLVLKRMDYKRLVTWVLIINSILICALAALTGFGVLSIGKLTLYLAINAIALLIVAAIVLAGIALSTALQKIVPVQLLGRVSGVDASFSLLAIPLGQMLFSLISDKASPGIALALFAVIALAAGLVAYFQYKPMLEIKPSYETGRSPPSDG